MKSVKSVTYLFISLLGIAAVGCTTGEAVGPNSPTRGAVLQDRAHAALEQMLSTDHHLQAVLKSAYAYAVLPDVGQGAVGIGGAGGKGVVYRDGKPIGEVTLNQLSLGPEVGGESYSELVIWENEPAFQRFENGHLEWGSQASAQILKAGATAADRFDQGVSVYLLPRSGFEVGASLNGQKMHFHPYNNDNNSNNENNNG